jgi:predicted MPP superfamily phosphohydrolase
MKQLLPYLFLILFLSILASANIYLASRFNFYFSIENTRILYYVFPVLTLMMIFGVMPFSNATSLAGSIMYMISAITMGVVLYLLISVLAVDIINLAGKFPPLIMGLSILAFTLLFSGYGMINAWNLQVTGQEVVMAGLTKEVRAMHLSDIHLGHFRGKKFLQRIVRRTNEQNVDVVFITGDLFDGRIRLDKNELAPLAQLKAPVYFIEGNHDRYTGVSIIKDYLRRLNVSVLENEIAHWGELQIIGLNHMLADSETYNMHAAGNSSTIKGTLEKLPVDKNMPTVLLHHSPDGIQYASQNGVDLYLAGHTHAGQLFPIKYIADLIFKYNKGLHDFNGTKIFVSQGAGTFGPPMRVGTQSEITLFKLKPATS